MHALRLSLDNAKAFHEAEIYYPNTIDVIDEQIRAEALLREDDCRPSVSG